MPEERRKYWRKTLVIGNPPIPWNCESIAGWYAALRRAGMESNVVPFIGHGTLRYAVAGDRSGPLTSAEQGRMLELLEEGFHTGAAGLSLCLIYIPAVFADRGELLSVAKKCASARRILAVHMRSESDQLLPALQEITSIAEKAGCRLHISHLKAIGRDNQAAIPEVLRHIDEHRLTYDVYPYDYGSTSMLSLLPPFILEGRSTTEAVEALNDGNIADRIGSTYSGREAVPPSSPWDNLPKLLGWENISIAELPEGASQELAGITGQSIAELQGTGGAGRIIDRFSCDGSVDAILRHPGAMVSSDTLLGRRDRMAYDKRSAENRGERVSDGHSGHAA
jgi:N-acyl-D-amino-acid deacylase